MGWGPYKWPLFKGGNWGYLISPLMSGVKTTLLTISYNWFLGPLFFGGSFDPQSHGGLDDDFPDFNQR